MTTEAIGNRGLTSLEELVGRLMDALRWEKPPAQVSGVARIVHKVRRMRQAGDLDGALAVLAGLDSATATSGEARWAYSEWLDLVRRRFGDSGPMVYSQGTGRAAALTSSEDGSLEVVAVLGMGWQTGKLVSRHSLRGLRPLVGGSPWP